MTSPSRIGGLAQDVLRHASLREGLTREQRLQLGAATLLAFVQQAHDSDALAVLQYAAELAGDRTRDTADAALNALADIGAVVDLIDEGHPQEITNAFAIIRQTLLTTLSGLRPTLPPYEEREAMSD